MKVKMVRASLPRTCESSSSNASIPTLADHAYMFYSTYQGGHHWWSLKDNPGAWDSHHVRASGQKTLI